jgi:alanine racemase
VAEIDLKALANNWSVLSGIQKSSSLTPVIKANAYGHGVAAFAQELQKMGAKRVAVALLEEAEELRRIGYKDPILVLGPFSTSDVPIAQSLGIIPMASDKQFLLNLGQKGFSGEIHVKWDTGMNRLGFAEADVTWLKETLRRFPQLRIQALGTHLLKGDDLGSSNGFSESQIQKFLRIESHFPEVQEKHIFNSDGFFANQMSGRLPFTYGSRPGLSLYGYSGVVSDATKKLKPVMTLKTKIVHLIDVKKGGTVSYNATWTAQRDSKIAILPIGYADGYPRILSNKGQVFVRGKVVPLVGTVCMDYLMIDVTDVEGADQGDDVELWGNNIPLEQIARAAGSITYELMTALTSRVPRMVLS